MIKPRRNIVRSPNPRSTSMRVYATFLREGISITFISKPNDINQAGYIHPILQKMRGDSDFCNEMNVDNILMRRKSSTGYNNFLQSDSQNE